MDTQPIATDDRNEKENIDSFLNMLKGFISCILTFVIIMLYNTNPSFFEEYMIYIIFLISLNVFNFVIPKKIGFYNEYKYAQKLKEQQLASSLSKYMKAKTENKLGELSGDLTIYIIGLLDLFRVPLPGSIALIGTIIHTMEANTMFILPVLSGFIGTIVLLFNVIVNEISKLNFKTN
tara:strand:- start:1456 stop:1989 length:534 start_codon:yes stop_codon:yes gene_type:complete